MGELKRLSKSDILAAADKATLVVDVPEWGGTVVIHSLTGAEAAAYWEANRKAKEKDGAMARMLSLSIVDGDGNRVFGEDDVPALKAKSMAALVRVQRAIIKLNNLDDEDEGSAKNG